MEIIVERIPRMNELLSSKWTFYVKLNSIELPTANTRWDVCGSRAIKTPEKQRCAKRLTDSNLNSIVMTSSGATRILLFARHCTTPSLSFCRPEKPLLTATNCLSHAASSFVWSQTRLNPRLSQKPIKFANYSLIVRAFHAFRNVSGDYRTGFN